MLINVCAETTKDQLYGRCAWITPFRAHFFQWLGVTRASDPLGFLRSQAFVLFKIFGINTKKHLYPTLNLKKRRTHPCYDSDVQSHLRECDVMA